MSGIGEINNRSDLKPKLGRQSVAQEGSSEDFSMILDNEIIKTNDTMLNNDKNFQKKKKQKNNNDSDIDAGFDDPFKEFVSKNIKQSQKLSGDVASNDLKLIKDNLLKNDQQLDIEIKPNNELDLNWQMIAKASFEKIFNEQNIDISKVLSLGNNDKNIELAAMFKNNQVPSTANIDFQNVYAEIIKEVKSSKEGDVTRLHLRLDPENLGRLDVYFVLEDKKLHISIAASDETKELLNENHQELVDLLSENGYELGGFSFSSAFSQGSVFQEKDALNGSRGGNIEDGILNILDKKDIISQVNNLLSDMVVDYIA